MKNILRLVLVLTFYSGVMFGQNKRVTGVVTSAEDGLEVIGASVKVKDNPSIGVSTDMDGKFTISIPENTKTLVVSYIGMETQEVPVKPVMKVVLKSNSRQLTEVVVTGMQKMDKRLFTGATTKIDAQKAKLDGVPDVSRALEGRAAGVSVQNVSGTFGTAPKIRVRGATSIYGNSRPLWVVDGVVMEDAVDVSTDALSSGDAETLISSAIAGLNADDIESFQILKDGSATSIYGARAMAGVIVITTKKGVAGKSHINYTGEFTTRLVPSYSDFNILNSQEQMGIYQEMEDKGWLEFANLVNGSASGVYGKMYDMINTYDVNTGKYLLANTRADKNRYLQGAEFLNTDWFDLLFSNSIQQNHAVSISTGTDRARTYFSLSAMNDPGWTLSSKVQRYTANANASFNLYKSLTLSLLTNGSYRKQKAPGTLNQQTDVVTGEVKRDFDINPYSFALNTSRTLDPNIYYKRFYTDFNIFHELENNYIDLSIVDLKFQGELNWKPVRGLELSGLAAIRYQSTFQEHHVKDDSNQANAYRAGVYPDNPTIRDANRLLYTDPDNPNALPVSILPEGGIYTAFNYTMRSEDFRGTVNYNTSINNDHIISLFGGVERNSTVRQKAWFRGWGYKYNDGGIPRYDYRVFKQGNEENTDYFSNVTTTYNRLAFFAMGTYNYAGRYTITGTGRYEGTNRLGKSRQSRWLPTWNVAGAWNAHEEEFFKNLQPAFSHATLRASYSLTADAGPGDVTNARAIYLNSNIWRPNNESAESAIYIANLENSELTYEKKHEFNVGVSLGFLNNRINFDADVYSRKNFDLIGLQRTEGAGGEIAKMANVASMNTHGYEFTLSTRNIVTKDFTWTTDFIFANAKTKITKLDTQTRVIDLVSGSGYALQGYPVRALFSIPFVGLNDEGLPMFINENNEVVTTDINFQEFEKKGYLKYEGPTDPTITGSFGNNFSYKGFHLNVFMTYSFGNVVRLDPIFKSAYSDLSSMPKEFKNRWRNPGDERYTTVPVIASMRQYKNDSNLSYAYNAYNYSTERIAKGDFIRLKEISLSYDFPSKWLSAIKFTNLQLKIQATNLCLLYADKKLNGQDPEFFNTGGVATPLPKQFTLTVRLGF
ncbi:MAG: SusC/RagA family TonB-linked outer membrane protein [Barnesiella sp.]